MKRLIPVLAALALATTVVARQGGLAVEQILKPSPSSWPTYNGDYSGQRFSGLAKITDRNVQHLSLASGEQRGPGDADREFREALGVFRPEQLGDVPLDAGAGVEHRARPAEDSARQAYAPRQIEWGAKGNSRCRGPADGEPSVRRADRRQ